MTLLDIAELPRVIDPQLSPSGRSVIYMMSRADWKAGRPTWHLWLQDTQGGAPRQLTSESNGAGYGVVDAYAAVRAALREP